MLINNSHSDINLPQLLLGNESLEKVNEFKLLGIMFKITCNGLLTYMLFL